MAENIEANVGGGESVSGEGVETASQPTEHVEEPSVGEGSPSGEAVQQPRRFKLKVRGEERELDEEEVVTAAQRFLGGDDKFKEAAKLRKEAEQIQKDLKSGDLKTSRAALQKAMGNDKLRALAIELLEEELREQSLTPEQRRVREAERKAQELEAKLKERDEAEAQARLEQQAAALTPHLDKEISDAVSASNLPKTPALLREIVKRRLEGLEEGHRIPFSVIVKEIEREQMEYGRSTFTALKDAPEKLVALLGEDLAQAVHKYYTGKLSKTTTVRNVASQAKPLSPAPRPTEEDDSNGISIEEFRERMEKIKREAAGGK